LSITETISNQNISKYCNGDNEGLSLFYKAELNGMVFYAYSFVKDKETALDVVTDVFQSMLSFNIQERKSRFDLTSTHFRNTLYLILRNKCLDHIKIEVNRKRILEEKFRLNGTVDLVSKNNAEEVFVSDSFNNLLGELGRRQKRVLQLHLDGFDNNEIAEKLEISYNTVRNTLSTSKKRVKDLWSIFFEN